MSGQVYSIQTAGGYMYGNQLSNVWRSAVQPLTKFRLFADGQQVFGKHRGQTFTWDISSDVVQPGGVLNETNTMNQTNFTVAQSTLTVTEYGNSVPWTNFLEDLAKFDVEGPTSRNLRNDCAKTLDRAAWSQFNVSPLRVLGSGTQSNASITLYTNGTVTGTNSANLTNSHIKLIVDLMKARNIPAFLTNDYYALANVSTYRPLKNELEQIHQYSSTGLQLIFDGEIGRYENTRFIEQTNIAPGNGVTGIASTATGGDMVPWVNGLSDWMFIFGEDTVYEGIVEPEHLRAAIPSDFGRSKALAWYYVGGFGLIQTQASQARIVKWDSQA